MIRHEWYKLRIQIRRDGRSETKTLKLILIVFLDWSVEGTNAAQKLFIAWDYEINFPRSYLIYGASGNIFQITISFCLFTNKNFIIFTKFHNLDDKASALNSPQIFEFSSCSYQIISRGETLLSFV